MNAQHDTAPCRSSTEEKFWAKVDKGDSCWQWQGGAFPNGYGYLLEFPGPRPGVGITHLAHRYAYRLLVGPIPEGLDLDHLCRNRACVNPDHLEPVTRRENLIRGETIPARAVAKTHCIHGHEFTPENTYIAPNGTRHCKECSRAKCRKQYWARKLALP